MNLEEHVEELERRINRQEKIIRIIGKNMAEEFDFDSLLNEIDEDTIVTEPTQVEVPEDLEVPETLEIPETPEPGSMDEVYNAAQAKIDELTKITEEQKEEIRQLKKIQSSTIEDVVVVNYEYANEAKAFMKEYNDLEMEKRELQERIKDLKEEYTDQGVDVKAALKAQKELIKELKETPDEANLTNQMKNIFSQDDSIMTSLTVQAG